MAQINLDLIKQIREKTDLSFGEIKKALEEANGDEARAMEILKERGAAVAEKKAGRQANDGLIGSYVHANGKVGAMLILACETDFVAKNADFQVLAKDLAMHLTAMKPANVEEFLAQPFVKNPDLTVKDLITQAVAKLGENIQIGRFEIFEI